MKNKLLHSFRLRATMLVAMMLCVVNAAWGADETVTFSAQGYSNQEEITSYSGTDFSITFNKGTNSSNPPKYFTSGTAIRAYGGNTFTISSSTKTISEIVLTFGTSDGSNTITTDVNTYTNGTWTGSATAVTFTIGGTSGNRRLSAIAVTYVTGGGTPTPTTYTVTYDANGGTGTMTDDDSPYEADDEVTLLTNTFTAPEGKLWSSWSVKDASDNDITVSNGKFTMPASNVTVSAQWADDPNAPQYEWVETSLANLTSSDVFVIVGTVSNSNYSMSNNSTSNPAASSVTIESGKITSAVSDNIKWNISGNATDGYTFYPYGSTTTWLYCNTTANSGSNTNLRVGTGTNPRKLFVADGTTLKTKDDNTARYWNVYSSGSDWRGYTSNSTSTTVKFYKRQVASTDPSIYASDPDMLAYDATSGSFNFTISNPVDGASTSVSENVDWISDATVSGNNVTFTTTANEAHEARTATITLTYTYGNNETVTKNVTITQTAAPVIYTTIQELFDAATSTETDVNVTFGGWVISAVNGSNAYLTDNQGHGLIIYKSGHGFQVNDVLTGTVNCKLKLYNGSAEFTNLTTSTEGLTVTNNGSVTAQNIAISELGGVNTGALLSFEGLSYNGTALVDGNSNTITPYNTLYSGTFVSGKSYDVTGIYAQYNDTKEILPRSAADIVEVVSSEPSITVATTTVNVAATDDNGTIGITYANLSINDESDFDIQFCDAGGNALSAGSEPTWIDVLVAEDNSDYVVSYTMDENTSTDARSAYFKVFAMGDADFVYSDLITVTQAGVVVDYATLPFEFDGGKSAIESTNGLTQEGLGNDYNSSPKLRFDNTDDYLILKLDAHNGATLSFDIKGNTFSGGTFTVQTSENGTDYTNLATYTELGTTQSESINLPSTVSYIKWIYTEKVSGNVALGNIKVRAGESVTVTSAGYAAIVTKNNVSFYNSEVTAYIVTATDTDQATLTEVEEAPAGTPLIVKADEGTYVLTVKNVVTKDVTGNLLQASDGSVTGDGSIFALGNKDGVGFYVVANGVTVPAGKPYLEISGSAGIKSFLAFNFGITTAISGLDAQKAERGTIYNLAGQRVNKAVKGIFIQNGKKIVVK